MRRKLIDLIERVGLRNCTMRSCPHCQNVGLMVTCPVTGTSYVVHTTDYKQVCTIPAQSEAVAA